MAEVRRQHDFEQIIDVKPIDGTQEEFQSVHAPWGYPSMSRIAGSIPLAEATAAAYKTVPDGFELHCLQSQFLKPGRIGIPLRYQVSRLMTSSNFASRNVLVRQGEGDETEVKTVLILSFFRKSLTTQGFPPEHEFIIPPSEDVRQAAAIPIDPELDDFNRPTTFNAPEGTPYPPLSSQRLEVTREPDVNSRKLRVKFRVKTPLSSSAGQIMAVIYLSDMFVMDAPLVAKGIDFGVPRVGDKSRTIPPNRLRQLASLNHTIRFARLEGFDVHKGLLFEVSTRWVKDRRGVSSVIIRDAEGELIATVEQEGYFVFTSPGEARRENGWMASRRMKM